MEEVRKTFICSHCGKTEDVKNLTSIGEDSLCEACADELLSICDYCGGLFYEHDNAGDEYITFCPRCSHHYVACEECGHYIRESQACYEEDSDTPYCHECFVAVCRNQFIHDYYYKPEPIFYGDGPRYFGVELEIDEGGEYPDNAEKILNIANASSEHVYIKHDGSLSRGVEIVSEPCTLDYHMNKLPGAGMLDKAINLGYLSHRTSTCGLHVHINREAFGETEAEQDESIARLLFFVEKHWDEMLRFSRRSAVQLERWASRYGFKDRPGDVLDHAKKGCCNGRYKSINLLNADTVELRIFRGTLKLNTFIATLQFVDMLCDVAVYYSDDEIKRLSWQTFVEGCKYPELIQYLKERKLYINEDVNAEEEV